MTTRGYQPSGDPKGPPLRFGKPFGSIGSSLCLACGLCCEGILYTHAVVKPDEIEHVRALGLTVETFGDTLGCRQPCPLYREQRCSAYPNCLSICKVYQCVMLKNYLAGGITCEEGLQTVQRARELLAAVLEQLPVGYSFDQLRKEMEQDWDSGRGIFGSAELRQANAAFLLTLAKLTRYLHRHFGKPKEGKTK